MKNGLIVIIIILLGIIYWQYNTIKQNESITGAIEIDTTETVDTEIIAPDKPSFVLDDLLVITSEADLKKTFGEENVKHSKGYYPEGLGEYENSLLFPGTPNEVEFVWQDDTLHFSGLAEIAIRADREGWENVDEIAWKTTDGIGVGTRLKELQDINKKPFEFGGFGWDYEGWTNWGDGYLSTKYLSITLNYPPEVKMDKYPSLWGDVGLSSDSEIAQEANPIVYKISMSMETD